MPKKLSTLRKKMAGLKSEMKKAAKVALKEEMKTFFEKHPVVEAIYWEQYTPYFNDGETCVFGVNDMWLKFVKTDEQKAKDREEEKEWAKRDKRPWDHYLGYSDTVEGAREEWDMKEYPYGENPQKFSKEEAAAAKDLKKIYKEVVDDDTFYDLFGDHVQVKADRKGFSVVEFQHD